MALLCATGTSAAEIAMQTKGSLPTKTSADAATLALREAAVIAELQAYAKLSAGSSVTSWEAKLNAAESAQATATTGAK